MPNQTFPSPELLGQFRQFGEFGPAYKICSAIRKLDDDDWLILIQIAETGEEIEYKFSKAQNDPLAH